MVPDSTGQPTRETVNDSVTPGPLDCSNPIPRALSFSWYAFITDAISVLSSVPFIVLACLLAGAKDEPVHQEPYQNFENGIRVAATALPVVYAAVFGRLATQVSRWKLERGASLPSIEQWLGSRTVFSAFLTQIQLGGLNKVGIAMILIWALSPLGAQSILRVFGTASKDLTSHSPLVYFDTNNPPVFTEFSLLRASHTQTLDPLALTRSIYAAAMLSTDGTKIGGQDSWGNVKIPYLSSYTSDPSNGSWVQVPDDGSSVFSSLVGIPAASTRPGSNLDFSFNVESSYIELQCSSIAPLTPEVGQQSIAEAFDNTSLVTSPSSTTNFPNVPNGTWQACVKDDNIHAKPWVLASDTFVDPLWLERKSRWTWSQRHSLGSTKRENITTYSPNAFANETGILTSQARLLLMTWNPPDSSKHLLAVSSTKCWISQPYVESKVECSRTDPSKWGECSVVAQRPSQKPHASTNITHLSFPWVFSYFSQDLPLASGLQFANGVPDASMLYLLNTSSSFILDEARDTRLTFANITSRDVSYRLGQLINSYLIASQAYDSVPGGKPSAYVNNLTTLASVHAYEEIYTVSIPWLVVLLVTSLVLFLGSIAGAVFCHMSKTPEILGFASAALRDSKYVDLAPGFGGLGGLEMTKAFNGIEFRYGVVGKTESGQEVLGVSWKVKAKLVEKGVAYV